MRIMDYPKTTEIVKGSTYLNIDSAASGTKAIEVDDLRKAMESFTGKQDFYNFLDSLGLPYPVRRTIYRGNNHGSVFTDEQKENIANGTFKGLFVGDYWLIGSISYRIADINYWIDTGDERCMENHLVIVPDSGLGTAKKMNDKNTTDGGYVGSKFYTEYYSEALDIINAVFGTDNILVHRELLSNAVVNGIATGGGWFNPNFVLMNEPMVYGSYICTPGFTSTETPYRYTIDKNQLALFQLHTEKIVCKSPSGGRENYWLRDVVSATAFAGVSFGGGANNYNSASAALYIRPAFGIVG